MQKSAGQQGGALPLVGSRPPVSRAFPLLALSVLAACLLALAPLDAGLSPAGNANSAKISIHRSEAHAAPAAQPYAYDFLESCAEAAGMSVPDYMLTCGIAIAGTTGLNIFAEDAGYSTVTTMHKLVGTAQWPDWDDLTSEQKSSWGDVDNYYAAQFNSLAGCFGLGNLRDTYYSNGGADFEGEPASLLSQIGDIGRQWANGKVVEFGEVAAMVQNRLDLISPSQFGQQYTINVLYDGVAVLAEVFEVSFANVNGAITSSSWFYHIRGQYHNQNIDKLYSKPTEVIDVGLNSTNNVFYLPVVGELLAYQYRVADSYEGLAKTSYASTQTWNVSKTKGDGTNYTSLNYFYSPGYRFPDGSLMFGGNGDGNVQSSIDYGQMPDTPDNVIGPEPDYDGYEDKYIGTTILKPEITYPQIFKDEPDKERPDNPYNPQNPDQPQNTSGTPEWNQETEDNMLPLLNVHLEKLFPFCLVYDLQMLWAKFQGIVTGSANGLRAQSVPNYNQIVVPIVLQSNALGIDINDELVLNLEPVHALLLEVKPYVFFLLVFSLLMSLIAFWKNILTGA